MKPYNNHSASASWAEQHRQAFEQDLRQALGTSQPALRRQAMERMVTHLLHPNQLIESPLLAANHPWRLEALAVSDAFESVTNGMEEPGVLEQLQSIDEGSLLQPWRHLILAMHFYYENLDEAVVQHLQKIPQNCPIAALGRMIQSLLQPPSKGNLTATLGKLAEQVAQPDPLMLQWVQDVAEGLETEQEELFWSGLIDWIEIVAVEFPERAQAAILWTWNQLEWRDFDEAVLLDLATSLWGRTESYRLAALGSLPWDPEGSALLWLRFLVGAAKEGNLDEAVIREARALLDHFHRAALEQAPLPEDWKSTWALLCISWNGEAQARGWHLLALPVGEDQMKAPNPEPQAGQAKGQLDLFS